MRADAAEADEGTHLAQVDPRQGTLLGFELPPDAFASMLGAVARGDSETAAASEDRATLSSQAAAEEASAAESASLAGNAPITTATSGAPGAPAMTDAPAEAQALDPTSMPTPQEILAAIEQALRPGKPVTARKTAAAKAASLKKATGPTPAGAVPLAVSSQRAQPESTVSVDAPRAAEPWELARTVTLLEASIAEERREAQERWRRTRHWFAFTLAALALLFVFSVAQTVALIAAADRERAAERLVQAALSEQQAALANLARAAAALSGPTAARPASASGAAATAPANAAPEPAQHARAAHARHAKEKAKPAAQQ